MVLTKEILDNLVEQAKVNPRLRQNMDLRTQSTCPDAGHGDASQRMLNAIEPGSVVPVHRHPQSTETVTVLRGAVRQSLYEEVHNRVRPLCAISLPKAPESDGVVCERSLKLVDQFIVEAGSSCPMYIVPAGTWHTTEALVSGTIIFEAKDGKYSEDGSESWEW